MKPIEKVKDRIKSTKYGKMFFERYDFKTMTLAVCSAVVNLGFAVFNLVCAVIYGSEWYAAFSCYYFALIIFRLAVICADFKGRKKYADDESGYWKLQNKIKLAGGAYLVIIEIAMGIVITQSVAVGRPVASGEITAITIAAYTFYKISMAVWNLHKARRHGNPVIQSLRNLNFADACMSMASLTVVLVATFGGGKDGKAMLAMKASVGFAACAVVLALATLMITGAVKRIKESE